MDDARDEETKGDRNEAEPHDQPERVDDRPDQVGNLEDSHVVLQPDPGHGTDTVPAKERVQDGQQEGNKHEDRVHQQRGQNEQPANKGLPADPFAEEGPPGERGSYGAVV